MNDGSKKYYRIASFVLVGVLVMSVGALAGWYVVLRQKGQTISWRDAARGFGFGAPEAGQNGSNFNNMGGGSGSGGFAIGGGGIGPLDGDGTGGFGSGPPAGGGGAFGQGSEDFSVGTGTQALTGSSGTGSSTAIVFKTPRLWRVTRAPVAGFEFSTSTYLLHYAERATGYMFRVDIVSGEILRRTNTLFPKTYEAYVAHDGTAILRGINDSSGALQTFTGAVGSSSSPNVGTLIGADLRNNLFAFDADPVSRTIFFMQPDGNVFSGYTAPWTPGRSSRETKVFSSPIASWKLFALADGRLMVAEKPHDGAPGYAYQIASDGTLRPIVRAAPGLTFLPQAGTNAVIFGTSEAGLLSLYTQTSTTTLALPVRTVADKCVWSPYRRASGSRPATDIVVYCAVPSSIDSRNFLRDWYMGALHTSDSWWRLNLTSGEADQILSSDVEGGVDVVDPTIDPTGSFLAFKNGFDGTLWVLRVVR